MMLLTNKLYALMQILTAAYAMPSFVNEPKNIRSLVGTKAKFKLTFSGKPCPGNGVNFFSMKLKI